MASFDLSQIPHIAQELESLSSLDDLCWALTDWGQRLCGLEDCVVYLKQGNVLKQAAALGEKRGSDIPGDEAIVNRIGIPIGSGLVGYVAATGVSRYTPDLSQETRYISDVYPGESEYTVPIVHRGTVLGVLDSESRELDGFSSDVRHLMDLLAALAAPHMYAFVGVGPNFHYAIQDLQGLRSESQPQNTDNLNEVFAKITERAALTLHVERANVWLFDESDATQLNCIDHYDAERMTHSYGATLDLSGSPTYLSALKTNRVLAATEPRTDPATQELVGYLDEQNVSSALSAPIRVGSDVVGVISLQHTGEPRSWTPDELAFAGTLSDFATIALVNHDKQQTQAALVQSQKLESLGRLAGGVAHDFNNLLTVINGATDTLQNSTLAPEENRALLRLITQAGDRATKLTRNLMVFSGQQQLHMGVLSIAELFEGFRGLTEGIVREDVNLTYDIAANEAHVEGDRNQLEQVILNLVINGIDAMPDGGKLTVSAWQDADQQVCIAVQDSGSGMSEATQARIFEPFFTTKGDTGTGLGLAISASIIKQHQGTLICAHSTQQGTRFEVRLPVSLRQPDAHQDELDANHTKPPAREQLLYVEDDLAVRQIVEGMLKAIGYDTLVAQDANHALQLIRENEISLLVSDVIMPDMRGPELYQHALKIKPGLAALFVSGYTEDMLIEIPQGDERVNFLSKPFGMRQLREAIEETVSSNRR